MNSLKSVEKRIVEDLFGMGSGYVLDFSNATFAEFFREAVNIDIYASKYDFNGDSKAKRFRAFWEIEPDSVVGKALKELLEVWVYEESCKGTNGVDDPRYKKAVDVAARLCGERPKNSVSTEKDFLSQQFENVSIKNINLDSALVSVLESRLTEAQNCFAAGSPLATIFLCGSILGVCRI